LHPHQIDVALFAFKSPLSKGALVADTAALTLEEKLAGQRQIKALIYKSCGVMPARKPSGRFWQCTCGKPELYPLSRAGSDLRNIADGS